MQLVGQMTLGLCEWVIIAPIDCAMLMELVGQVDQRVSMFLCCPGLFISISPLSSPFVCLYLCIVLFSMKFNIRRSLHSCEDIYKQRPNNPFWNMTFGMQGPQNVHNAWKCDWEVPGLKVASYSRLAIGRRGDQRYSLCTELWAERGPPCTYNIKSRNETSEYR